MCLCVSSQLKRICEGVEMHQIGRNGDPMYGNSGGKGTYHVFSHRQILNGIDLITLTCTNIQTPWMLKRTYLNGRRGTGRKTEGRKGADDRNISKEKWYVFMRMSQWNPLFYIVTKRLIWKMGREGKEEQRWILGERKT